MAFSFLRSGPGLRVEDIRDAQYAYDDVRREVKELSEGVVVFSENPLPKNSLLPYCASDYERLNVSVGDRISIAIGDPVILNDCIYLGEVELDDDMANAISVFPEEDKLFLCFMRPHNEGLVWVNYKHVCDAEKVELW